jgi:hypothetical protein
MARTRQWAHGADRTLTSVYGALVLPLLAYSLIGAVGGSRSMTGGMAPLVAFGATPVRAALAIISVGAAACALVGGVLAAVVAVIAHGSADPPMARDAVTSAYVGAVGGIAYASWFGLGATLGRRSTGRTLLLLVDWGLGSPDSATSVLTPRGHLRSLLGGISPANLPQRSSALALMLLGIGCVLLTMRLCRRSG